MELNRTASRITFLSTLSLRRATNRGPYHVKRHEISIHTLLAESDKASLMLIYGFFISIHTLLAESDNRFGRSIDVQLVFLSTLSLRRAT